MIKVVAFAVLSLPLVWLCIAIAADISNPGSMLGADAGETILFHLGDWGIRCLLLALSVSTIRRWLKIPKILRVRRMVGVFAFTYLFLHFLTYLWFFAGFDWALIGEDLTERPYITVGFTALVILSLLTATSTNGWQRRLRHRWRQLHKLVYLAASLGVLHFWWLTKDGYGEVLAYGLWLGVLFVDRWLASRAVNTNQLGVKA
ncbi:MAG: sulfoxide reductase heme-binding subunit YedZ [Gammaproteobacteria bacterium]|nr:sulfoxide reductase heme-binding subunit YedZ [Gammaproteobacteria bacterium]